MTASLSEDPARSEAAFKQAELVRLLHGAQRAASSLQDHLIGIKVAAGDGRIDLPTNFKRRLESLISMSYADSVCSTGDRELKVLHGDGMAFRFLNALDVSWREEHPS